MSKELNSLGFNKKPSDTTVVVAMSGGVDSSTVAGMMKKEGYKVIGITLKLYDDGKEVAASKQCCSGQDIMDAKRVAHKLDIEHKILYYQDKFKQGVIDNFVESYLKGETPIPCVQCNQTVKFKDLFEVAKDLNADALVTGHYVKSITEKNTTNMYRAFIYLQGGSTTTGAFRQMIGTQSRDYALSHELDEATIKQKGLLLFLK